MQRNSSSPEHKLVVLGDSISQGFQNGGIYRTDLNFPSFLRNCWEPTPDFDQPIFTAQAGIPLNLEVLARGLSDEFGDSIEWQEYLPAISHLYSTLRRVKRYWEGRIKSLKRERELPYHNQSVWGFAMNDAWMVTEEKSRKHIEEQPETYSIFDMLPDHAMYVTARLVLNPSFDEKFSQHTQIDNVQYLQDNGGIENLIATMGHNNIIGAASDLKYVLSEEEDLTQFPSERDYTVYRPEHFEQEYRKFAEKVSQIGAQRVITQTIPYVTIPPVTRGVNADKSREGHTGYFDYYTRFWIWDEDFDPDKHPHLTKEQAISLDVGRETARAEKRLDGYRSGYLAVAQGATGWLERTRSAFQDIRRRMYDGFRSALMENAGRAAAGRRHRVRPQGLLRGRGRQRLHQHSAQRVLGHCHSHHGRLRRYCTGNAARAVYFGGADDLGLWHHCRTDRYRNG